VTENLPSWMTQGKIPARQPIPERPVQPEPEPVVAPDDAVTEEEDALASVRAFMAGDVKSWGRWMLGLGVLHLLVNKFLDPAWGILLILVGIPTFFVQSASLYVIFALTLLWAAFGNALSGWGGAAFALFQVYLAWKVFRKYRAMRKLGLVAEEREQAYGDAGPKPLIPRVFPWLGIIGGAILLFGVVAGIGFLVILNAIYYEVERVPGQDVLLFLLMMLFSFSPVVIGLNLSSLLGQYRPRFLAWLGLIFSSITLILFLALTLAGSP